MYFLNKQRDKMITKNRAAERVSRRERELLRLVVGGYKV